MTGQQLLHAAEYGNAAEVRTLLSTPGAQSFINYQGRAGFTPLHFAAYHGQEVVTGQLIAARCTVDLQTHLGSTPLHYAAHNGHSTVIEQLIAAHE